MTVLLHCLGAVIQKIKELFIISVTDKCRLWELYVANSYALLNNLEDK